MRMIKKHEKELLYNELRKSYNFFIKEANTNKKGKGYGLIKDKTILADDIASIASVGYGLAALIIGVEHNWINYKKAYDRANRTLDTFINNVDGENGFYYHFVNMKTGKREWNCEVSIIDTAILICGAITAGEYFGKKVKNKADILYKKVNWEWYRNNTNNLFYMGYKPEKGFWGQWDGYAEQLVMYVLGVGSPTYLVDKSMYYEFNRKKKDYKDIKDIIYTYCGSLFTYQYSHAWIDFRNLIDINGVNWFKNSIKATRANREYCIDNKNKFKTYGENSGTISPCGAIGSIVFTPRESIKAMEYYSTFRKLWEKYGFKDGFNLEGEKEWFAREYIGVDKGIGLLMIENYLNETIWKCFMKNEYVIKGLKMLGFTKIKSDDLKLINALCLK